MATKKTVDDLAEITGLKPEHAKTCFAAFEHYGQALASFAQSFPLIPKDYFLDDRAQFKHREAINAELRATYKALRAIKDAKQFTDKEAWEEFKKGSPAATDISFGSGFVTVEPATKAASNMFGFNTTSTPTPTPASASPAPAGFSFSAGFGAAAAPSKPVEDHPKAERKVYKEVPPAHFTGPFLEMPLFWQEEVVGRAPLLNLNSGFLERTDKKKLRARLEPWLEKAAFYKNMPVVYREMEDEDEETGRVIIKDSVRTFFHEEHREKFTKFLWAMFNEFQSYGQAMSYLAGICLLVFNEQETAAILRHVSKTHIPGHWAAEAVGFAVSAWVVEKFIDKKFPDVAASFDKLHFWPDTYLQKIISGLCVHVLKFQELFDFLDAFMAGGFPYLIRFCLAIIEHFRDAILRIQDPTKINELYEIMRLDIRAVDVQDVKAILARAPNVDLGELGESVDVLRMEVYDSKVGPRLKRAPKTEAFEPCAVCEKNRPKWWSDDLGAVCEECKAKAPGDYTNY